MSKRERERERETDRQTDRQTETDREREKDNGQMNRNTWRRKKGQQHRQIDNQRDLCETARDLPSPLSSLSSPFLLSMGK